MCAQMVVETALKDPENLKAKDYAFDNEWLSYRAQHWAFVLKQIFCVIAILIAVLVILICLGTH